jgi:hypothetical protein
MRRKSPQQKKRESYLHDRRNTYGENNKSSRTSIRRRRQWRSRANRRAAATVLTGAQGATDPEVEAVVEARLRGKRPKVWRKCADDPLGEVVLDRLRRRLRRGIESEASVAVKGRRILRTTRRTVADEPMRTWFDIPDGWQ